MAALSRPRIRPLPPIPVSIPTMTGLSRVDAQTPYPSSTQNRYSATTIASRAGSHSTAETLPVYSPPEVHISGSFSESDQSTRVDSPVLLDASLAREPPHYSTLPLSERPTTSTTTVTAAIYRDRQQSASVLEAGATEIPQPLNTNTLPQLLNDGIGDIGRHTALGFVFVDEDLYRLCQSGRVDQLHHTGRGVACEDQGEDDEEEGELPPSGPSIISDTNGDGLSYYDSPLSPPFPLLPPGDENDRLHYVTDQLPPTGLYNIRNTSSYDSDGPPFPPLRIEYLPSDLISRQHDREFHLDLPTSISPTCPEPNNDGWSRSPSLPLHLFPNEHEVDDVAAAQQHCRNRSSDCNQLSPWQKVHQRLLNWAIIWSTRELDQALNSAMRGNQVNGVALSIWSTQMYKRYVRARLTERWRVVDRIFVPPNVADAINTAVSNGHKTQACGMLKDLWIPFGLEGMPRLLVVLTKHRSDPNHWVVHQFSLTKGKLTTYDAYHERSPPDGRPLGWWSIIRLTWPEATSPDPENALQLKVVRLHRPQQPFSDNAVAAAGIWRNLLMGSRAERNFDPERLRHVMSLDIRNLRQRKEKGRLSISGALRPNFWEEEMDH